VTANYSPSSKEIQCFSTFSDYNISALLQIRLMTLYSGFEKLLISSNHFLRLSKLSLLVKSNTNTMPIQLRKKAQLTDRKGSFPEVSNNCNLILLSPMRRSLNPSRMRSLCLSTNYLFRYMDIKVDLPTPESPRITIWN